MRSAIGSCLESRQQRAERRACEDAGPALGAPPLWRLVVEQLQQAALQAGAGVGAAWAKSGKWPTGWGSS